MRILLTGLLGAIAMYAWSAFAHMATPLGEMGISALKNEQPVIDALRGEASGLYQFPWSTDMSEEGLKTLQSRFDSSGSGLLAFLAPGEARVAMGRPLALEFASELVQSLLAAWLLTMAAISAYLGRVIFVTGIGAAVAIGTNVSYLIWYGFPLNYTLGYIVIQLVGYLAAGIVMAAMVKRPMLSGAA